MSIFSIIFIFKNESLKLSFTPTGALVYVLAINITDFILVSI